MIHLSFYLSPDRTTMSLLADLFDSLSACGVPLEKLTFAGLTGHMGALGLAPLEALSLMDVLENYPATVTNVRSDTLGDYRSAMGEGYAMTPDKVRAYIVMNGRMTGDYI